MDEIKIIERLTRVEADTKSIGERLSDLARLTESVHKIAVNTEHMREDLNDITERVDDIERKPSKRWEMVITALITAIVGAAMGYLFRGGM